MQKASLRALREKGLASAPASCMCDFNQCRCISVWL